MERYRLLGIEHDGREAASARVVSREPNKWGVFPLHTFNSGDEVVLAADAQATIAALEQRVKELKQWVQDQSTANLETMRHMDEMQSRAMDAEYQLTQRTAELEADKADAQDANRLLRRELSKLREKYDAECVMSEGLQAQLTQRTAELNEIEKIVDIDSGKTLIEKVRDLKHSFKQVYDSYQDAANEMFKAQDERTAELEADKASQAIDLKNNNAYREQVATLQAELERVRADNKALDEWRADVTVSLQRPGGAFFVDVPQHIKDLVKERDDLRTLIAALPKVEGEIAVKHTEVDLSYVWGITLNGYFTFQSALFDGKEEAEAYATILKHRQGMEG